MLYTNATLPASLQDITPAASLIPGEGKDLLESYGLDRETVCRLLADTLDGADDGELFLEQTQSESLVFDNGRLKSSTFDTGQGFGMRAIAGEMAGYSHSGEIDMGSLKRAADAVRSVGQGYGGVLALAPNKINRNLYDSLNPVDSMALGAKIALLEDINAYARDKDQRVRQVTASLSGSWRRIAILRADGSFVEDIRPLVRINVGVVVGEGSRQEAGSHGFGGRNAYDFYLEENGLEGGWQNAVDEAVRQALVNLDAVDAPAGELDVVLGPGWPGVLLHEAVGHGLEGDFNRRKSSAFSELMGQQVAAKGVTVVDDGTLGGKRGSLTIDDEGTPTQRTPLIEDGILVGYMQDRQNGRLMGGQSTGNGRRQSYAHLPMPRMTNTIMEPGEHAPEEILKSVKNGLYAVNFGGGQVDITSGKFVFSCTEAYRIEDGKIGAPVKGATLIGNGPAAMKRISMIGNDMALDTGIGTCGKQGQGVPVGVGQPTLRIDGITVGGTATG
ncbi:MULTISPECIES: metalloprotease TldD [Cohaesibacter]|uniref:metalloprotease TldD n=1 Tax=Cohaesibacter TaxID=655352 RepID=UPI000DE8AA11|nr:MULTISPECIES: metalloprotease TldD [Cohaesibacter]TLP45578.1 metalloprotease TldD [Cohaesibacter sp. CAU 1516]